MKNIMLLFVILGLFALPLVSAETDLLINCIKKEGLTGLPTLYTFSSEENPVEYYTTYFKVTACYRAGQVNTDAYYAWRPHSWLYQGKLNEVAKIVDWPAAGFSFKCIADKENVCRQPNFECTVACDSAESSERDQCKKECTINWIRCLESGEIACENELKAEVMKWANDYKKRMPKSIQKTPSEQKNTPYNDDTSPNYLETDTAEEIKQFNDDIKSINDNVKDLLEASDFSKDDLAILEEFSENLDAISNDLKNVRWGTDLWNIINTDGPEESWEEMDYDDAMPGFWTRFKRALNIFSRGSRDINSGKKVQDMYNAMAQRKAEREFYRQSVSNRLIQYALEQTINEVSDKIKEETEGIIKNVIGISGILTSNMLVGSLKMVATEQQKQGIGNYYLAYEKYRAQLGSHEKALIQIKIDIGEGGINTGDSAGGFLPDDYSSIEETDFFSVNDKEILMESFNKIYQHEHP